MQFKPRLKIYKSSSGKNTFNPETFEGRSYNHWLYVAKIKGKVVFNNYSYSMTTNKHQGEMRDFLKKEMKVKNMIYVNQRQSLDAGIFLDNHYMILALAETRLKTKNKSKSYYKNQKDIVSETKKVIATLKKLGAKELDGDLTYYRRFAEQRESARLESQREKSKTARIARQTVISQFKSQYESTQAVEV